MQHFLTRIKRLEKGLQARNALPSPDLELLKADPLRVLTAAGIMPDPWQAALLKQASDRTILLCSRQAGKSTVAAALAVQTALLVPKSPILLLSPTLRQSGELFRKVIDLYMALNAPIKILSQTTLKMELANGSRIVSLPGTEGTIRGFSGVSLLVIDEAARVADPLYFSVRPMLAVSQGRMIALSTPFGQRGWFYDVRVKDPDWNKVKISAHECPRITKEFLESERRALGERWYKQEYLCHLPETRVWLANGTIKPICELRLGDVLVHYDAATGKKSPCRVTHYQEMGCKEITTVYTEIGTQFSASTFHPVNTRSGRTELLQATELQYVLRTNYTTDPKEALARLVGHNMGDGTIALRRSTYRKLDGTLSQYGTYYQAAFYSKHHDDLIRLAEDLVLAGLRTDPANITLKKSKPGQPDTWQVQANRHTSRLLVEAGCPVGKKKEQAFDVPDWIKHGTPEIKREFLAALFGAEGNMPIQSSGKNRKCNEPCLSMWKSRAEDGIPFFDSLVRLLGDWGIQAKTNHHLRANGWVFRVWVCAGIDNVKRFYDRIGYRYIEQMEIKAFQWSAYYGAYLHEAKERKTRVRVLRRCGMTFQQIGRLLGCRPGVAYKLCISPIRQPARDFPKFAEWVAPRWHNGSLFVEIVDRYQQNPRPVVNIEVDSPDHSYLLADGLNNFNCGFEDTIDAVFSSEDIQAALSDDVKPLFG